jgi:hypothetical protein
MKNHYTMRSLLLITIITLTAFSCKKTEKAEPTYTESLELQSSELSRDSMRALYLERIEKREDPFPTQQVLEQGKLYPVDAAPLDTSFFVFREQLTDAVREKDIFFLLDKIDENIVIGEQARGLSAFAQQWDLTSEAATLQSPLWDVLGRLLLQGGVFNKLQNQFRSPYYFATYPEEERGPQAGVILGAGVRMRSAPDLNSKILKNLTHDLIDILETTTEETTINEETYPWVKVRMKDELEGYVWGKFVGRAEQEQLVFQKTDRGWKIITLIRKA